MSKSDQLWETIKAEAESETEKEPALKNYLASAILYHGSLEHALAFILSQKIAGEILDTESLRGLFNDAFLNDQEISTNTRADLEAFVDRDAACPTPLTPILFFKGFHALTAYRMANYYWKNNKQCLARMLQSRISEMLGVDIHPAAKIGKGILLDHGTGIVIGETAVVEDDVSILHSVTLGGTGKETGDRHPKVRKGVLISAGAKILGNVEIGQGAKIGANAVVLTDVPAHTTFVGVPAKNTGKTVHDNPALEMDHAAGIVED